MTSNRAARDLCDITYFFRPRSLGVNLHSAERQIPFRANLASMLTIRPAYCTQQGSPDAICLYTAACMAVAGAVAGIGLLLEH